MSHILKLPQNTHGRDFVVGDIHGAFTLLEQALTEARFDPATDRVISVGDLIDRGPHSLRSLEFLQQPWFFAVRGNHEDMFLEIIRADGSFEADAAAGNIRNGMGWVFEEKAETLAALRQKFSALPLAIELATPRGTVGFVHAEVPSGMDWESFKEKLEQGEEHTIQTALWGRTRVTKQDAAGVAGIDRIFFGHTPQEDGAKRHGNCYYIDTGAVARLVGGHVQYCLTLSDIMAKTQTLVEGAAGREKNIVTALPEKPKPFGAYSLPPKL
jgi:serine/threonine protein phosphatase 1